MFLRHARAGGYPRLRAHRFLDSAKASLRGLPPSFEGAGTQE